MYVGAANDWLFAKVTVIEQYIQQLRSIDMDVRRSAIVALGKVGDPRALQALAHVYLTDPEPGLRELAAKVGRYIQSQQKSATNEQAAGTRTDSRSSGEGLWPDWASGGVAHSRKGQFSAEFQPTFRQDTPAAPTEHQVRQAKASTWETPRTAVNTTESEIKQSLKALVSVAGTKDEPTAATAPNPIQPPQFVSKQRQELAQGQLRQAYHYRAVDDLVNAKAALAQALQADPGIAADTSTRNLAAELMGLSPKEAVAAVMRKADAGDIQPRRSGLRDFFDRAGTRRLTILAAEAPLLFVTLLLFVVVLSYRLRTSATADDFSFVLPALIAKLTGPALGRAIPLSIGTMAVVVFFVFVVYYVGTFSAGTGTLLRFMTIMLGVQIVVFLVVSMGFLFVPFAEFIPAGPPGQYWARIHLTGVMIGLLWAVLFEAYFVARAHRLTFYQGATVTLVGFVVAAILGGVLGLFRGSIFG